VAIVRLLVAGVANGVLLGGIYGLSALGLSLVFGVMKLMNIAQGDFMVVSAYLVYYLTTAFGMNPFLAVVPALAFLFLFGYGVQAAFLQPIRSAGMEAGLVTTLGLSTLIENLLLVLFTSNTRSLSFGIASTGLNAGVLTVPAGYLAGFGLALVVVAALYFLLEKTPFGRMTRAAAESETVASLMGVDVPRVYRLMFALAAVVSAVAGLVMAMLFGFDPTSGLSFLLTAFIVVILGGLGNVTGTVLAGMVLGAVQGVGTTLLGGQYRDLITYVIFLVLLLAMPSGLLRSGGAAR
jgi:branched-chain amino acid transport system permease protein